MVWMSSPFPRPTRLLLSLLAIVVLSLACCWSLRRAYAEHLFLNQTEEAAVRARNLIPGDARYQARWADFDPAARISGLEAAVALNPMYSAVWVEMGLRAEMSNDFPKAEKCLLEAARVDKTFEPRWTLANYYFRRDEPEKFWSWAREAAAMAYGDPVALFRLCWKVTEDPGVILRRAIPERQEILAAYLSFLLAENRLEAAEPVAQRILERATREHAPLLLNCSSRLLEARRVEEAIGIWNSLASRRLIPHQALAPEAGISLTNGDFTALPLLEGFDWRIHSPPGVSVTRVAEPPMLKIAFSGKQPESCVILEQLLPLVPARKYRLRFGYQSSGIRPGAGLSWRVLDTVTGRELSPASVDLSQEDWTEETLPLSMPAEARLARLTLSYQRAPGTTRIEGSISLRRLTLGFSE